MYKTSQLNESLDNKWCILTKTFFVEILSNYNENFYKVQYGNLSGFAKKNEVQLVNEIPQNPYPMQNTFSIKNNTSCYLRSTPKTTNVINNVLSIIPSATNNLTYLGKIIGEEAIDMQGSVWYLTEYNNQIGYVYSYYTNSFLPEQENTEITTIKLSLQSTTLNPLTNTNNLLLITIILLPLIAILIMLYKPPKKPAVAKPSTSRENCNVLDSTRHYNEPDL